MFKNRVAQISFPKTSATSEEPTTNPYLDPETMIPIIRDLSVDGVKLGLTAYAAVKVLNTVCEIAKIAAQAKL